MKRTLLIGISLCSLGAPAFAASQVLLETPIGYAPGAEVVERVRTECKIEDLLSNRVGDVLRRRNRGGDGRIAVGADAAGAQVLRLQISHVLGIGGGAWTGPKAITVIAEMIEDGKVVRQTKLNRWSVGGFWGGFRGTCSILDRSAIALGKDLGRWARDPSYVPKEEPRPQEPEQREGQPDPSAPVPATPEAAEPEQAARVPDSAGTSAATQ